MNWVWVHVSACLAALLLAAPEPVRADTYPSKQITLVVPFAAGGSNDVIARVIAERIQKSLGQPVVVENQTGAAGSIGVARVAKSDPDGHTLVLISSTLTINAVLQPRSSFDAQASFAPVALIARSPLVLATSPKLGVKTPAEFLALAKANPGELNFGTAGNGSINHIGAELLKAGAGIDLTHVPYRGVPLAMNDLIGGHLDLIVGSLPAMLEQVRTGRATGIAVTSKARSPALPELSTLDATIAPGYELYQWWAVLAPAGTPHAVVERLNAEINAALGSDEVKAALAREGAEITPGPPVVLTTLIRDEIARWQKLADENKIRAE
jgi:tripartite-type tricarboxylate transporter receptor subunit TctC